MIPAAMLLGGKAVRAYGAQEEYHERSRQLAHSAGQAMQMAKEERESRRFRAGQAARTRVRNAGTITALIGSAGVMMQGAAVNVLATSLREDTLRKLGEERTSRVTERDLVIQAEELRKAAKKARKAGTIAAVGSLL